MTRVSSARFLSVLVMCVLAGCGGGSPVSSQTTASPPIESPTDTPTTDTPTTDTPTIETTTPGTTVESPPTSRPTITSGQALTLEDVFAKEGQWDESRYDIADRTEIQGMAATLESCGEYYAATLELRLAHKFSRLKMNVGQANSSPSSDAVLVVEIVANERQLDTRKVPFDRLQGFDADVRKVNALKLRFWLHETNCGSDSEVVAVIEKLTLFG